MRSGRTGIGAVQVTRRVKYLHILFFLTHKIYLDERQSISIINGPYKDRMEFELRNLNTFGKKFLQNECREIPARLVVKNKSPWIKESGSLFH